jgi:hypothetical protein
MQLGLVFCGMVFFGISVIVVATLDYTWLSELLEGIAR